MADEIGEIRREKIPVAVESVAAGRGLLALPGANPSVGLTLEVMGLETMGFLLKITDPLGYRVWEMLLEATPGQELMDG